MISHLTFTILSLCAVSIGASTTNPDTPSVFCDKPKATVCQIKKLPEAPEGVAIVLPDLSHRTELRVKEGTLGNLTRAMIEPKGTKLRLVQMEALGLESFFVLPNFVELRLGRNRLSTIVVPTDESSFALKILDMRYNRLNNATQLAPFVQLEELYLDDNFLTELSMGLFERMNNLRVLSVARNNLTKVTPPAVTGGVFMLPNLELLSLAFNQLSDLRVAQWQLPSLRLLLLNNNKLVELPELDSFDQFYSLERLALAGNSWSCAWLAQTLQSATFEIVRDDAASETHSNCTFENVAGVCCQFTVTGETETTELFRPEIEIARAMSMRIDGRHEVYLRYGKDQVDKFATFVREQLEKLHELVQSAGPQFVNMEQVVSLRQSVTDLSSQLAQLEVSTQVILDAERMQKRLLHFMLDMKNKLVRQAIETDTVLDQVEQEWATFDRRLEERLAQKKKKQIVDD